MDVQQYVLVIDYVPGQGWEAAFEGDEPTLGTGGFGWEAQDPGSLLVSVARALKRRQVPVCEPGPPWPLHCNTETHCDGAGAWGATGVMPPGHVWQWTNANHTGGYLAHVIQATTEGTKCPTSSDT